MLGRPVEWECTHAGQEGKQPHLHLRINERLVVKIGHCSGTEFKINRIVGQELVMD